MEQQPKDPLTIDDKIERAFILKSEGNDYFKANDLQSAIRKYHNALLYVKGLASRRGTLEALGADCSVSEINEVTEERKAKIEELEFLCYNNLAASLLKKQKYERVIDYANKALELQPENTKALFRRGTAHMHIQDYLAAEKDFKKVLQVDPTEKATQRYMQQIEVYKEKELQKQKQMYSKMF